MECFRSAAWSCWYRAQVISRSLNRWRCAQVLQNYRPQWPGRSISVTLYSYMDCLMR
jgi:hypothetical protein